MYVCMYVYICMYVCIYIYIHRLVKEKTYFQNISAIAFFCCFLQSSFTFATFYDTEFFLRLKNTCGNTYNKNNYSYKKKVFKSNYKQLNKLLNKLANE